MGKRVLAISFIIIAQLCCAQHHCLQIKDVSSQRIIQDFYIVKYAGKNAKPFYSDSAGKICDYHHIVQKADSVVVFFNFQKQRLSNNLELNKPLEVEVNNLLDPVIIGGTETSIRVGPSRGKNGQFILKNQEQFGLAYKLGVANGGRSIEKILININKNQSFNKRRRSSSSFNVSIYHAADSVLNKPELIYRNLGDSFEIKEDFKGWFEIDISSKQIKLPQYGYLIIMLKVENGGIVINCYKNNRNPKYTNMFLDLLSSGYTFRSSENIPLPGINLVLEN